MATARGVRLALLLAGLAAFVLGGRAAAQPPAQSQPPILVREIAVEGHRRIQEAVILGRVQTKVGAPFDPGRISEDVRAIFGLGFFDDVQVKVGEFEGGVKVTFVVVERPFVRDLAFAGNQRISTSDLEEKIDLKLGNVYNPVDVQRARQKLVEHYESEGYFEVQITPEVETFPDGDVRVVFTINEGRRMTIDRIVIEGNRGLTAREIKRVLATRERQFFILRGVVQRQLLEEDAERIVALYGDHGYIQARVDKYDVAVNRERARVTITFVVVEGPQYRVHDIQFTGVTLVPEPEVRRLVRLEPGDVFSRGKVRDAARAITDLYSNLGRASAEVSPRTEPVPDGNRLSVVFEINEGPEVYVERINVSGNLRTHDRVLRREIPLAEGQLFTLQKLQRARQRLLNLGYFESVNITTQPGTDKTRIVVNVQVTERPTGLFSIGGGFSSVDGAIGTLDLSQRNFLGRGWETTIRLRGSARTQQGVISFTEPWLFDRPLAAGFDLFNLRRQFVEYDFDSLGGNLRLSHPFAEFWRWHLGYRLTRDEISDLQAGAAPSLQEEEGTRITSLVSGALARDSRDSVIAPSRGGQTTLTVEFAGLGGDSQFVKTIGSTSYFKPVWRDHILSGRVEAGYGVGWADDPLPLFERFFLGGPNSFRGVKFRQISPRDSSGVRIGGTSELLGNLEYIVPLPFNFRLAGFFDIGNVYGFSTDFDPTNTREAAGAGVRWLSPFGPIRVDYGVNLDRRKGEDFGALHFSVGSPF